VTRREANEAGLVDSVIAVPGAQLHATGNEDAAFGLSGLLWTQRTPSVEAKFPSSQSDVLELTLSGAQTYEVSLDGCPMGRRRYEAGHAALWPAGTELSLRGESDADVLHLILDRSILRSAEETLDCRGWSIDPIRAVHSRELIELGLLIVREPLLSEIHGKCFAETLRLKLAKAIFTGLGSRRAQRVDRPTLSPRRLRLVLEFMRENMTSNISLVELAQLAGVSQHHFLRCFRDAMGVPPHQHLLELRLAEARRRLSKKSDSLPQVALDLGFSSQSHFTSTFSRRFGIAPGAYRSLFRRAA
jgi:AraC family transcriptional regulator